MVWSAGKVAILGVINHHLWEPCTTHGMGPQFVFEVGANNYFITNWCSFQYANELCFFFWCRVLSVPTLTCGVFVFSAVSAPSSSRLSSHSNTPYSSSVTLPVAFAWQVWDLVHCKGVGCTPWRPPHHSHTHIPITLTRAHITHTHTHPTHTSHSHTRTHIHPNHTLTHISPLVSAALPVAFAWQARDLVHCKGVRCTPWRPSGVLASLRITHTHTSQSHIHHTLTHISLTHTSHTHSLAHTSLTHTHIPHTHTSHSHTHTHTSQSHTPRTHTHHPWSPPLCRWLLRGRRGTWCTAKGSDVRPGVPPVSWRPSASLTHTHPNHTYTTHSHTSRSHIHHTHTHTHSHTHTSLTHTSHTHLTLTHTHTHTSQSHTHTLHTHTHITLGLRRSAGGFCMAGAGLGALQRGWMYALASLRCPSGVPPVSLRCPLVSTALPVAFAWQTVAFAWQARDLVLDR